MRFLLPLIAVILIASLSPNNSLSLVAYVIVSVLSLFMIAGLLRKASPQQRRQIILTFTVTLTVALGIGVLLYLL